MEKYSQLNNVDPNISNVEQTLVETPTGDSIDHVTSITPSGLMDEYMGDLIKRVAIEEQAKPIVSGVALKTGNNESSDARWKLKSWTSKEVHQNRQIGSDVGQFGVKRRSKSEPGYSGKDGKADNTIATGSALKTCRSATLLQTRNETFARRVIKPKNTSTANLASEEPMVPGGDKPELPKIEEVCRPSDFDSKKGSEVERVFFRQITTNFGEPRIADTTQRHSSNVKYPQRKGPNIIKPVIRPSSNATAKPVSVRRDGVPKQN